MTSLSKSEPRSFILETFHNTILAIEDDIVCHSEKRDSLRPFELRLDLESTSSGSPVLFNKQWCQIFLLEENFVALRLDNMFLCADEALHPVSFSRSRIGPWERFRLNSASGAHSIKAQHGYVGIQSGTHQVWVHKEIEVTCEVFLSPRSLMNNEKDYFQSKPKHFFELDPGEMHLVPNAIMRGTDKIMTTRFGSHGSLFDRSGFYHNAGFMFLRHDTSDILLSEAGAFVDFENLKDHGINGSFCSPFDGNSHNYYHWLLEGMVSLYLIRKSGVNAPPIIVVSEKGLQSWQKEYLSLFDVPYYLIVNGGRTDALHVGELYWLKHRNLTDIPRATLREIRDFILGRIGLGLDSAPSRKIYIRRKNAARSVSNDDEVARFLEGRGFISVSLEEIQLCKQIDLFANCDIVVAPHGAGLANLIFCKPATVVVELLPEDRFIRTCFWCLAEKMSLSYMYLCCKSEAGYALNIEVDISCLASLFDVSPNAAGV